MLFNSQIHIGCKLGDFPQSLIKIEPMLLRADRAFAEKNAGPLTRNFLANLPWDNIVVDSRVHMLMPGMYPYTTGWHHDDVPRERSDGQPNYDNPSYRAQHCMALWGDCSLTEFALGLHEIEIPPVGQKIYKELSPKIEELCRQGKLNRINVLENYLLFFDCESWHRASPATKNGFRFFIRATRDTGLKPRNEIR